MSNSHEMIVIIRPGFKKICLDGCRAAVFNHALYWIAQKSKGQPKDKIQNGEITWYATTEEIAEGMSDTWGVCKVRKEVNALFDMGILGRCKNPDWGADRTKHFFFGKEQCAKLLALCKKYNVCLLHIGLRAEVLQMINLSNASDKSIECICENHHLHSMNLSDAFDESIEAITKDSTKVTTKDKDTNSVAAIADDEARKLLEEKDAEIARLRAQLEQRASTTLPVVNATHETQSIAAVTTGSESVPSNPPKENKPRGQRGSQKKQTRSGPLTLPDLDGPATEETILQLAEYLRGYHYAAGAKLTRATNDGVKPLLELGYTLRQIDTVWRLLSSRKRLREEIDKPWLVDQRYIDGGYSLDLWNLPDKMEVKLQLAAKLEAEHSSKRPDSQSSNKGHSVSGRRNYTFDAPTEVKTYAPMTDPVEEHAAEPPPFEPSTAPIKLRRVADLQAALAANL